MPQRSDTCTLSSHGEEQERTLSSKKVQQHTNNHAGVLLTSWGNFERISRIELETQLETKLSLNANLTNEEQKLSLQLLVPINEDCKQLLKTT